MIQYFSPERRFLQRLGWIDMYYLFSCGDYFDPNNLFFSNIIALNEYIIQPGFGFNMHPHEEVEQVFLVMEGNLTHADSLGNQGVLTENAIQAISAGNGYARYAYNLGTTPCRYIAIWLTPQSMNIKPRYAFTILHEAKEKGTYLPIVSSDAHIEYSTGASKILPINSNSIIYYTEPASEQITLENEEDKNTLIYTLNGCIRVNNEPVHKGGHVRISGKEKLHITGTSEAKAIVISMW